jgi:hypothetical protein
VGAARKAWDAAKHPRGPNGRFISAGGSGGATAKKTSLAENVLGTAATGPKRQRSARSLMQGGAAAGKAAKAVSAGKAAAHSPEADIRAAVKRLEPKGYSSWVGIADLRDELGSKYTRDEVDQALRGMLADPNVQIIPIANRKGLNQRDRDAELEIGGEGHHAIEIDDRPRMSYEEQLARANASSRTSSAEQAAGPKASKAKTPRTARSTFDAARAAQIRNQLTTANSRDAARQALSGLTAAQLRQVAADRGITVGSKFTKERLINAIVDATAGRRLDSAALGRR